MISDRLDRITLFDLHFKGGYVSDSRLDQVLLGANDESNMNKLLDESFQGIFEESTDSGWLPGLYRIDVLHLISEAEAKDVKGATLFVCLEYGVAVLSIWRFADCSEDFNKTHKGMLHDDAGLIDALAAKGLAVDQAKREYPFTAIRVGDPNIAAWADKHAIDLGGLFHGGIEEEEEQWLRQPIREGNLSRRRFERLYITWTDAVALYSRSGGDDRKLDLTMFRAFQLFETSVIVSRLFKTIQLEIDKTYASLRGWWPRPWRVNQLTKSVATINRDFIISPPVDSIEAVRLLTDVYAACELDKEVSRAQMRATLLETRFQWSKTQFLAGVAIAVFTLERLSIFTWLAKAIRLVRSR